MRKEMFNPIAAEQVEASLCSSAGPLIQYDANGDGCFINGLTFHTRLAFPRGSSKSVSFWVSLVHYYMDAVLRIRTDGLSAWLHWFPLHSLFGQGRGTENARCTQRAFVSTAFFRISLRSHFTTPLLVTNGECNHASEALPALMCVSPKLASKSSSGVCRYTL